MTRRSLANGAPARHAKDSRRLAIVLALVVASACSGPNEADPGREASAWGSDGAAATIRTQIDFSARPFHGTFTLDEGAEALGCSAGSFVDAENGFGGIDKEFTCDEGVMQGTFTVRAHPLALGCVGTPERCTGSWSIDSTRSTGDFVGLHGFGEFEVAFDEDGSSAVETLTGEIYG